ncbi:hypothetical protein LEP1GSC193_0670 [Leptospira alstonii serovar Pingchang str. 80-412]|uniref:Uncharacterized protein n=2 Tax=Leptospira alstonii TaxID=28452 RepID=M6D458_9LEPT|nr:hypothetical protein LEP1GSC194_1557 [Leptospira alstonii serovar Sichuan str. 79601]EQA82189.1 hypothetical protein LEP1GSC193_0670 [Leptospira alstonii serovar Pingchang str. 80-412]
MRFRFLWKFFYEERGGTGSFCFVRVGIWFSIELDFAN